MCGRYTCKSKIEEISDIIPGKFKYPDIPPRYNIAPSQEALIVTFADGDYSGHMAKWGLLPPWLKGKSQPFINARSETILEKPSFRGLYKKNHCAVVADGFYEWVNINGRKQPRYFYLKDNRPFAFAGFYQLEKVSDKLTFVIMTADANQDIRSYHNRMPVILDRDDIEVWLKAKDQAVLRQYEGDINSHFVSPIVNNPRNDTEGCIVPYAQPD